MIQSKLLLLEELFKNNPSKYQWDLYTIQRIKELLSQIDLSAEVVPLENKKALLQLLTSLKEEELTEEEKYLVEEITTIQF